MANISFGYKIKGKEKFKKEKISSYEKIRGLSWSSLISDGENTIYQGTYKEIMSKLQDTKSRAGN